MSGFSCLRCVTPAKCGVHGCCHGTWPAEVIYPHHCATKTKTNAERQAAHRQRKAAANTTEVRGIFAHADDKPPIKAFAAKLAKKRSKVPHD